MQLLIWQIWQVNNSSDYIMICDASRKRLNRLKMIQAYVFTGAAGSGRREVMADLLAWSSQTPGERQSFVVFVPEGEKSVSNEVFDGIADVLSWNGVGEALEMPSIPEGTDVAFILLDGLANPVDQFENLATWLQNHPEVELARVLTVVNSRLLFEKPGLKLWFDALVHFSDVVLFNNRAEVPNKWFSDFKQRFVKECYPCMFELVKDGRVHNPAEVLYPEARRMSLAFDFLEADTLANSSDALLTDYEIVDETENEDAGVVVEDEEEDESPEPEKFFERDAAGRRRIRLPDIKAHL